MWRILAISRQLSNKCAGAESVGSFPDAQSCKSPEHDSSNAQALEKVGHTLCTSADSIENHGLDNVSADNELDGVSITSLSAAIRNFLEDSVKSLPRCSALEVWIPISSETRER